MFDMRTLFLSILIYFGILTAASSDPASSPSEVRRCVLKHNRVFPRTGELVWAWGPSGFREQTDQIAPDTFAFEGWLGWHLTWAAWFTEESGETTVYETWKDGEQIVFGRMPMPPDLIDAFERCGVKFAGPWQGDLPRFPERSLPRPPDWKSLSRDELLPPPTRL